MERHLTRLSLRGDGVARNSDSSKVPTQNRLGSHGANSDPEVTSHQSLPVFEESVRNAGYLSGEWGRPAKAGQNGGSRYSVAARSHSHPLHLRELDFKGLFTCSGQESTPDSFLFGQAVASPPFSRNYNAKTVIDMRPPPLVVVHALIVRRSTTPHLPLTQKRRTPSAHMAVPLPFSHCCHCASVSPQRMARACSAS